MIVNPYVEDAIKTYVQIYLTKNDSCTMRDLLNNYSSNENATENELRAVISQLIEEGYLQILEGKKNYDNFSLCLAKPFNFNKLVNELSIVVSKPNLKEISIQGIEDRNHQINSVDCFCHIMSSAKETIRICSPFIQHNVLLSDSFPEFEKLLTNALNKGIEIRLLTRELHKRKDDVQWIIDIACKINKENSLKIVDYHLHESNGNIISSTHAKLLIADYETAYVGSAELRKNSLIINLEVGCMIKGPSVFGLCEIFDFMFSQGDCLQ